MFFKVLGTIMTACVVLLWIAVSIPTVHGFITGSLFQAPCLVKLPELLQGPDREKTKEPENGQVKSGVVGVENGKGNGRLGNGSAR
jgi:hypothetical protein